MWVAPLRCDMKLPASRTPGLGRRAVLGGVATGVAALAGCLGGDENTDDENGQDSDETGNGDETNDASPDWAVPHAPEDVGAVPVCGDPAASVTLAVYEDFVCPHCANYNATFFPDIVAEYLDPASIRYEHRTFPVVHEEYSFEAGNAARAVFEEFGNPAFWEFKSRLFAQQDRIGTTDGQVYADVATAMGLDAGPVESAVQSRTHDDDIQTDVSRGTEAGVNSTPSFVVDGALIRPEQGDTMADLVDRVRAELDAALDASGNTDDGNGGD